MKIFKCKMKDGSKFVMPEKSWQKAFELKYGKRVQSTEFKKAFVEEVAKYWRKKKVPTKFEWDENWETYFKERKRESFEGKETFKNQAELAQVVMYYIIRVPLLSIIFSKLSTGKGKVIGIDKEGFTVYDGKDKRKYKNLENVLKKIKPKKS